MKCPKCQFENREGVKFCEGCGTKLELVCPSCRARVPADRLFCGECGSSLRAPTITPPVDYSNPQSYTPKFLADKILTTRGSIEGERKLVTVLFADVANYTAMSEKLDPEEVHQIVDGCFRILMDEIHRYEGTITQFTGDGAMALFGAPIAHEDHAQRACYAALSIQKALVEYGERVKKQCGMDFKMRMGLNSGPVVVGSIGDDLRVDYTAIGDTTNLASRMETMARPGTVFVSGHTQKLALNFFQFEPLGKVSVKGKEELQEAYELIRPSEVKTRIEAAAAKGLTKFVGRKNSTAVLMEAYEKVQSGAGQVVGVVGEAGVGKSRLLLEFRNRLLQEEFTYLEGRCIHFGVAMAYLPILDILRSYFHVEEGEREFSIRKKLKEKVFKLDEKLQTVIPPLQELFSLKVEDETFTKLEPKQKREKIFESIRDLLIRESQNRVLIVSVEDLHWIDKTSEEFFNYFIGWLANQKILLVLLQRPEYTHQWGNKSYYNRLGVNQLTLKSSTELVQAILEGGEVAPELRDLILNRAAGNPLFLEELTHTLLENGSIQREENQYVLARRPSDLQIPETIQGIIAARMDRLEENLKKILQVASVIGREFAFRILQAIIEMKEGLKSQLLNLQGLELIYEKTLFPELEYIFKHALTQEVAYNSLLLKRRREIHEKIGRATEEFYPDRLEEFYETLAYHYSRSNNLDKACHYLKLSGNKSTKNHSLWEAYRFYKETINVLRQMPETEQNKREQIEVILLMYIPMRLLGYPEDSIKFLQEGERLSKELGDRKKMATFNNWIGIYYSFTGNPLLGRKYSEEAFGEAEKISDVEIMASSGAGLVNSYLIEGEFTKIADIAPKVFTLMEKTHRESEFFMPSNAYSYFMGMTGFSLGELGEFKEGEQLCEKALSFAHKFSHLFTIGSAELQYGVLFVIKGDGENSVKHLQRSTEYLEKSQAVIFLPTAWSFLGYGYNLLGKLNKALECIEKALKIQKDIGLPYFLSLHHFHLSMVYLDLGNLDEAKAHVEQALKLAQTNHEKHYEGLSWLQLGRTIGRMEKSQLHKAEELILKGMKILEELKLKPWYSLGHLFLGELYADASQKEKAVENLKKAEGPFQEMGMDYWLARTRKFLAEL